jgi:mycofactocin precursor
MTVSITEDNPTDPDGPSVVAGVDPAPEVAGTDEARTDEAPLIEEDLLVEDVSIDGMCGVY